MIHASHARAIAGKGSREECSAAVSAFVRNVALLMGLQWTYVIVPSDFAYEILDDLRNASYEARIYREVRQGGTIVFISWAEAV